MSTEALTTTTTEPEPETLPNPLEAYAAYPFDTDETYLQGLSSLIAAGSIDPNAAEGIKDEMIRRTRVFYFNKITGNSLSMEAAREYEISGLTDMTTPSETPESTNVFSTTSGEDRALTLAELKELIESGNVDQIPNNKLIPEKINDAVPSASIAPVRKKPWENTAAEAELPPDS